MDRLNLIKSKEYWIEVLENAKYNKLSNESIAENIVDKISETLIVTRKSQKLPKITLEKAIKKAKNNLDKIKDVDKFIDEIR